MDLEVKPNEWTLPNRIGFASDIYKTFHPSKYPVKIRKESCACDKDDCEIPSDTILLFPQQRIVRDFIQVNSPYRGILLYHELGSGKSGASIAAAEGYVGKNKVYVLTPASLAQNYENELMKISQVGLNMKKSWFLVNVPDTKENQTFMFERYGISLKEFKPRDKTDKSKDIWIPLYDDDVSGAVVMKNGKPSSFDKSEKMKIDEQILHIIKNKYSFISYNGLTQAIVTKLVPTKTVNNFDNSFIVIDEIHNFISRVANGSKLARSVYNAIMSANNCKMVLLSGTPIINSPYEIATLINLIRGPMKVNSYRLLKNSKQPTHQEITKALTDGDVYKYVDNVEYNLAQNTIDFVLLPVGYVRKDNSSNHITKSEWLSIDFFDNIKAKLQNVTSTNEAEISFKIPSLTIFNNILKSLKKRATESNLVLKSQNSLDIGYNYDNDGLSSYRITINKLENINNILPNISKLENHEVFALLCTDILQKKKDILIIEKIKESQNIIDDTTNNLRFRLSEEKPVNDKKIKELQNLNKQKGNQIIFRFKNRSSLLLFEDDNVIISIDLTLVKTSNKALDITKGRESYELEVEILFKKDVKNLDKKYVTMFRDEVGYLIKFIQNTEEVTSPSVDEMIKTALKKTKINVGKIPAKVPLYYALPNTQLEFDKMFIDSTKEEDLKTKNMDLFQRRILGTMSYYKTSGTEFFPTVLPNHIQYLDMTPHQQSKYIEQRNKERSMESKQSNNALSDKQSVYRAFSRMICNFAFPKHIERHFPNELKKLSQADAAIDDDDDDEDIKLDAKSKKTKDEYKKHLDDVVDKVSKDDNLSMDNLRNEYSPKYAQMLTDIHESPGSVLIYSQFRTVEGLGIFSKVLNFHEYKEITIEKVNKEYKIKDISSVFDTKYDNKRYVVFDGDRITTNILMNLFNGAFTLLPESILLQLKEIPNYADQLYGKLVKIMMITQSGSEGISLKNVRRVLIMEYFWNAVRINQVIGRAVRTCSHEMLPKADRNVQTFTYLMKFSDAFKKNKTTFFTLEKRDKSLTTDEYIYQIACKKENIINQFLNMLKAASFDCIINSVQNEPMKNGYKCYNWAVNANQTDLSFTENIEKDYNIQKHQKYQKLKSDRGRVVSKDGKKFVLMNGKIYDYHAYVNAGILMSV